ncbi:regulator of G-protein signaling 21-like [Engraulis encrasicolus]|uniref:regulator of G-protein signaling 21-like n=1 Tax=Engraulis encrasicolus TaxID=184585 RepID=UPI002FD5CDA3
MDLGQFKDNTLVFHPGCKQTIHKTWKLRIHIRPSQMKTTSQKKMKGLTVAGLDLWTKSFDCLLSDQNGQMAFTLFLKSEFCEENIEFWLACEEFKCVKTKKTLSSTAVDIYEQFIRNGSPKQINLDFHTRDCTTKNLQNPTPTCFVAAQRKIFQLMENSAYPRFLQSDFYKELHSMAITTAKKKQRRVLD